MKNFQVRQILILFLIFYFTQVIFSQQNNNSNLTVSINGKFFKESSRIGEKASSGNGIYWCTYKIGHVSDEVRQLKDFTLYENDIKLYSIKLAPGSDVYISNSGIAAFINMKEHFKQKITIIFFSKAGSKLLSESFNGASHFGFSPEGEVFGVGTPDNIFIISVMKNRIEKYGKGFQFDISENEELVAIASKNKVKVFFHKKLINKFKTGFMHTRKIKISKKNNILAVIDKKNLKVYSLTKKNLLFSSRLKGENSFRDLLIEDSQIYTGIHYRCDGISKGILRKYDLKGMILSEREDVVKQFKTFEKQDNSKNTTTEYPPIPWPFVPFDSMHTVWNHYEQHMGGYGSDFSYLHQGLDLITPIGEPTYAVAEGYVKCVLTLGGAVYWRIAVGRENSAGYSNGWLYAHLIESTIQFDVGDTVQIHDYLGDIIQWADDWGHIHFAEIRDTGLVWQYDDNEWGITYNPQLSLIPNTDTIPPVIDNIFPEQKFAFCLNETSTYLDPDSLYGDIDIIIKVIDYAGDSPWQQPAFTTYYQVKKIPEGNIVFPRTLGQILNHSYNFYSSGNYEPYATVLYKRDEYLFPSSWMDMERRYHHILTNNNGDSLAELSEKNLAFPTANYPDGDYRIIVEAFDENGNMVMDSMDVYFSNTPNSFSENNSAMLEEFYLIQNYPNPFNPETMIRYNLKKNSAVKLIIYNAIGQRIKTLVNQKMDAGLNEVRWDGKDFNGNQVSSGIYFYRLTTLDFTKTKKMLLIR